MKDRINTLISSSRERWSKFRVNVLPWFILALFVGFFASRGNITVSLSIGTPPVAATVASADTLPALAGVAPSFTVTADAGIVSAPKPARLMFSDYEPQTADDEKAVAYIRRFAAVAQVEAEDYGQPASVKLAQALLESGKGESWLAVNANAHFGFKCFAKNCKPGHCVNRTDDSHKDFFRKYGNAWESFRDHSLLLQKPLYADCHKETTPEGWCECLKRKGYATAKKYDRHLIRLIDKYGLREFDK